jgi:hypothetical protein
MIALLFAKIADPLFRPNVHLRPAPAHLQKSLSATFWISRPITATLQGVPP